MNRDKNEWLFAAAAFAISAAFAGGFLIGWIVRSSS